MSCNYNQSFCANNKQSMNDLLPDIIASNDELQKILQDFENPLDFLITSEQINANIWDLLNKIFIAINEYGELGDRNFPKKLSDNNIEGFPDIEQFKLIGPEAYNDIVDIVKKNNLLQTFSHVDKYNLILGTYLKDLKDYINNFLIDKNRCNSCNVSCYSNDACEQGGGCYCMYCERCNTCEGCNTLAQVDIGCNDCDAAMAECLGGCQTGCEHHCQSMCEGSYMSCDVYETDCNKNCQAHCEYCQTSAELNCALNGESSGPCVNCEIVCEGQSCGDCQFMCLGQCLDGCYGCESLMDCMVYAQG